MTPAGKITEYPIPQPFPTGTTVPRGVVAGGDGNVWYADGFGYVGRVNVASATDSGVTIDNANAYGWDFSDIHALSASAAAGGIRPLADPCPGLTFLVRPISTGVTGTAQKITIPLAGGCANLLGIIESSGPKSPDGVFVILTVLNAGPSNVFDGTVTLTRSGSWKNPRISATSGTCTLEPLVCTNLTVLAAGGTFIQLFGFDASDRMDLTAVIGSPSTPDPDPKNNIVAARLEGGWTSTLPSDESAAVLEPVVR